jgi:hypothetical protein
MSQIVTPEEMAALFEELGAAEGGRAFLPCGPPVRLRSRGWVFPEPNRITPCQNLSNWLMALADLQWPHL